MLFIHFESVCSASTEDGNGQFGSISGNRRAVDYFVWEGVAIKYTSILDLDLFTLKYAEIISFIVHLSGVLYILCYMSSECCQSASCLLNTLLMHVTESLTLIDEIQSNQLRQKILTIILKELELI